MLEILLRRASTLRCRAVLPEMTETIGVSRSSLSPGLIETSEEELKRLCECRWDDVELLVIYVGGIVFGDDHLPVAVAVNGKGSKRVLGLAEGASENEVAGRDLLEDLVRRGVKSDRKYLFVIDGPRRSSKPGE